MSNTKKILIILFSFLFGVVFVMAVSLFVIRFSGKAVSTGTLSESSSISGDGVEKIQLTVELGKVRLVPSETDEITVHCRYPSEDFLDNQLRIISDRDGSDLSIRINSKRRIYFFGLIKDKACEITVGIPEGLLPALEVKLLAGTLTVDGPALRSLDIDGDVCEINLLGLESAALEQVSVYNNIGNITAYLDLFSDRTVEKFTASVNIGLVELHLRMDEEGQQGYHLDYAYNIGTFEHKDEQVSGLGRSGSYETPESPAALYQVKTDIGGIRVYEDRTAA